MIIFTKNFIETILRLLVLFIVIKNKQRGELDGNNK